MFVNDDETYKSRSQKKRESTALQKIGEELATLSHAALVRLRIPGDLIELIDEYHSLPSREAKRRHMQYIGRYMREQENPETIINALASLKENTKEANKKFALVETTRNKLLDDDPDTRHDTLQQVVLDFPALEPGKLQHLITAALAERAKKKPPRAFRELFRYLQSVMNPTTSVDPTT